MGQLLESFDDRAFGFVGYCDLYSDGRLEEPRVEWSRASRNPELGVHHIASTVRNRRGRKAGTHQILQHFECEVARSRRV